MSELNHLSNEIIPNTSYHEHFQTPWIRIMKFPKSANEKKMHPKFSPKMPLLNNIPNKSQIICKSQTNSDNLRFILRILLIWDLNRKTWKNILNQLKIPEEENTVTWSIYHVPSEVWCQVASICIPLQLTTRDRGGVHVNEFQNLLFQKDLNHRIFKIRFHEILFSTLWNPLFQNHFLIGRDLKNNTRKRPFSGFFGGEEFLVSCSSEKSHCFTICIAMFELFVWGTWIETLIVTAKVCWTGDVEMTW